jgi:hypothetical protein
VKDFDAQKLREGTFKIAGEEFRYVLGASPQAVARLVKEAGDRRKERGEDESGNGTNEQLANDPGALILDQATDVDQEILFFLRDDAERTRWIELRDRDKGISMTDMAEILAWLWEEETGRPPTQPDSSSDLPSTNGTTSTEPSSTEQAEASKT